MSELTANDLALKQARRDEIDGVKTGLHYLAALVEGDGVLAWEDHHDAVKACEAVAAFVKKVKGALDGATPNDDLMVLCPVDPVPHIMKFHAMHESP